MERTIESVPYEMFIRIVSLRSNKYINGSNTLSVLQLRTGHRIFRDILSTLCYVPNKPVNQMLGKI